SMGGGVDARDSTRDEAPVRAARSGRLNFACPTPYCDKTGRLSRELNIQFTGCAIRIAIYSRQYCG
ncbi:hypothetical protein, partial [Burkholderia ubonensis]|uniref:hypothetical protein n=1 Tax=Burkholderia ubonensis TaxID=101571 RepID=UPI001E3BB9FB